VFLKASMSCEDENITINYESSIRDWIAFLKSNRKTWYHEIPSDHLGKINEMADFLKLLCRWMENTADVDKVVKSSPSIGPFLGLLSLIPELFIVETLCSNVIDCCFIS